MRLRIYDKRTLSLPQSLILFSRTYLDVISTNTSNGPKFVCKALSYHMSLAVSNHHYSSSPENPGIGIASTSRPHIREIRQHPLRVTGMFLYYLALMTTKSFSLSSPQSVQPPPSQHPPWERKAILYYRDRRGENLAVETCAERFPMRGME
jgi:hypothetical protein